MKKLMLAIMCLFVLSSTTIVLAQDPVKPATEQKDGDKETVKDTKDEKDAAKTEKSETEKPAEKADTDTKEAEPAK